MVNVNVVKFNQVIVNYVNPDLEFTNQQEVFRIDGDKTIDKEEELTGEFTFHTITNPSIAQDLAQMIYKNQEVNVQLNLQAHKN
jgi:hypothetical protein